MKIPAQERRASVGKSARFFPAAGYLDTTFPAQSSVHASMDQGIAGHIDPQKLCDLVLILGHQIAILLSNAGNDAAR